jgi:hypothetical protein
VVRTRQRRSPSATRERAINLAAAPQHDSGGGCAETRERAAGESYTEALLREGARLAPPPATGKAGPPILLRVDRRPVEPKRPAGHAALAGRRPVEQHGMPVLSKPRNDVGGPERAESAARPGQTDAQPELEPVLIAEPEPEPLQSPVEDLSGPHPEPPGGRRCGRRRRMAHMRARVGGQGHESPAPVASPTRAAQHDDHRLPGHDAPVVTLHAGAVVAAGIAEREIGAALPVRGVKAGHAPLAEAAW